MTPLVNAHTHLYSGLVPLGMPAPTVTPRSFVEILQQVWWKLDLSLDEPSLRAAAELYVVEARAHGTAALIDHHESPAMISGVLDLLADVCQLHGMAAVLCYGVTERNGGPAEARRGLAECARFIEENRRPLVRGCIGLHASFTVSDETIREAAELARSLGARLHLHVAEDLADVDDARERGYSGVLDRLEQLGALVPGTVLAHGVHLTRAEVARCAELGCWLVHNPRSNRGNGVGYAGQLCATDRVALGTDGYASDMLAEQAALEELAAAAGEPPVVAKQRLEAGRQLVAQWFDEELAPVPDTARAQARRALPELRLRAQKQADAVWARMSAL